MVKFVLDADASIKLAKGGVLEPLIRSAKCFITKQVYEEILKGKDKMYEDAFCTERLVREGKLSLSNITAEGIEGLGEGECSALALFRKLMADSIISDDRRFLSILEARRIPFIISTDVIAMLCIKRQISKIEAMAALEKIRRLVREENYNSAKRTIGGK
ncbi:hypothetical protein HYY74_03820 [Candidatus Woesearchaeota archaeon]|nr:hypothetical protein [Candidatus Woesearchaeota archaeon]